MRIECPECNGHLENIDAGYYHCENCDTVYTFAERRWKYVSDYGGFITGEFDGEIGDIMVVGNGR